MIPLHFACLCGIWLDFDLKKLHLIRKLEMLLDRNQKYCKFYISHILPPLIIIPGARNFIPLIKLIAKFKINIYY
jgi:hypothetical protein